MYIAGRLRTASRPSRTLMLSAPYSSLCAPLVTLFFSLIHLIPIQQRSLSRCKNMITIRHRDTDETWLLIRGSLGSVSRCLRRLYVFRHTRIGMIT